MNQWEKRFPYEAEPEMSLREISAERVTSTVRNLCTGANIVLRDDVIEALKKGLEKEESPAGRDILNQLGKTGASPKKRAFESWGGEK